MTDGSTAEGGERVSSDGAAGGAATAGDDAATAGDDGTTGRDDGTTGRGDDRPERPPAQRLIDALGVVEHAKRGAAVGLALAAAVFGFFVVVPAVDPGTASRTESPLLFLALAFVVATSGTLLAGSALAVRAVAGRVMAYGKWVRRGAVVGGLGGAAWAAVGALALAAGTASTGLETAALSVLPLPVLALAAGAWSALARTGVGPTTDDADPAASGAFDHVAARPRAANAGAGLALVGVAVVHVATFLESAAFLGAEPVGVASAAVLGTVAIAVGTFALAAGVADRIDGTALPVGAAAAAALAAGLAVGGALAGATAATPVAAAVLPGLAWLALGVAVARDAGTYPERPV